MTKQPENYDDYLKEICRELAIEIYRGKRLDIRDKIAAIGMLLKARELWPSDDKSRAGSAVRKYESLFQKAPGDAGGTADTGPADADTASNGGDTNAELPNTSS